MYGPKCPFLLLYGSHDMRHTGIPRVDGLSTDSRVLGRHNTILLFAQNFNKLILYINIDLRYIYIHYFLHF